jgi:hypothetical protein
LNFLNKKTSNVINAYTTLHTQNEILRSTCLYYICNPLSQGISKVMSAPTSSVFYPLTSTIFYEYMDHLNSSFVTMLTSFVVCRIWLLCCTMIMSVSFNQPVWPNHLDHLLINSEVLQLHLCHYVFE